MWPPWTERIAVGVDGSTVAWCPAGGERTGVHAQTAQMAPIAQIAPAPDDGHKARAPGRVAAVVVHGRQCGHWMQSAPPGLAAMSELRSLVDARAASLFGESQEWMTGADFSLQRPFLCAALPLQGAAQLTRWAGAGALRQLHTSLTAMLRLCRRQLPQTGWAWLLDDDRGHCVYFNEGAVGAVRTVVHGATGMTQPLVQLAQQQLRAAAAVSGHPLPERPVVVDPRLDRERTGALEGALIVGLGLELPAAADPAGWCLGLAAALARGGA